MIALTFDDSLWEALAAPLPEDRETRQRMRTAVHDAVVTLRNSRGAYRAFSGEVGEHRKRLNRISQKARELESLLRDEPLASSFLGEGSIFFDEALVHGQETVKTIVTLRHLSAEAAQAADNLPALRRKEEIMSNQRARRVFFDAIFQAWADLVGPLPKTRGGPHVRFCLELYRLHVPADEGQQTDEEAVFHALREWHSGARV